MVDKYEDLLLLLGAAASWTCIASIGKKTKRRPSIWIHPIIANRDEQSKVLSTSGTSAIRSNPALF